MKPALIVNENFPYSALVKLRSAGVAILYIRQEPYSPVHPAEWILALIAEPDQVHGYMVVIGEHIVRRRPLPGYSK